MRLAWFSPMPPVRTGVAACSAELVAALLSEHQIEVFVDRVPPDQPGNRRTPLIRSAHDFVAAHQLRPYDLTVYQLGNSSHHDFEWPYVFRYPGLAVLHDAHLHHSRAASLLRTRRFDDYRAEFAANHPDVNVELAELTVAGFDNHLYYSWPMTRLVVAASRMSVVHTPALASRMREEVPGAAVAAVRLGHGIAVSEDDRLRSRARVRRATGIPEGAVVFGVFGGLTPEKRVPQVLDAFQAILPYAADARLVLAGAPAGHYDVVGDIRARGLEARVTLTGYIEKDDELTDTIAAVDVALNLRWPTAREVSGPWLRALAAGVPTVTMDLWHTGHVPSLDPRTWQPNHAGTEPAVTIALDILDEDHSLRLAMRRLATDPGLRRSLGDAGREYWEREHSVERMLSDYRPLLAKAAGLPAPRIDLPAHLVASGDRRLRELLAAFGMGEAIWSTL